MVAELYIVAESFANNTNFTTPEIESKTKSLANDFVYIKKYSETNRLFVHPDIYAVNFITGVSLSDLLHNPKIAKEHLDRDVYGALQNIIDKSATTTHTSQEVIEVLLPEYNENLCHGLIAFNPVPSVQPELQIVYHLQGWFEFRRHFLGLYPKNENFYIDECIKYFPNLYFHERNRTTISAIFDDCPKKIIYHLTALNDKFKLIDKAGRNRTQVLEAFSITAELDETASLEGNAARKDDFTFTFSNHQKKEVNVCCEPHLKLCFSDTSNAYSNERRIYFHEGIERIQDGEIIEIIQDGKILIGHIGGHL
ncbi:MAG: hypothetical protein IPH61_06895 [Bacteroidetes bacterium]|nr:hypothetical protein [Bacteroidota bacterium]